MSNRGGSYIEYILSKINKMRKELDQESRIFSGDHVFFESIREQPIHEHRSFAKDLSDSIKSHMGKDAGIHVIETNKKEEKPDFQNKAMKLIYGDEAMPNEKDVNYFDAGQIEADGRWGINNPEGVTIIKP